MRKSSEDYKVILIDCIIDRKWLTNRECYFIFWFQILSSEYRVLSRFNNAITERSSSYFDGQIDWI